MRLQESNANPNASDNDGVTPLHWACYLGDVKLITPLLAYGANVSSVTKDGTRPLLIAASYGHVRAILLLLHAGANLSDVDSKGRTAPMLASARGHTDAVRLLLLYGADPSILDGSKLSAADHAFTARHNTVLDVLLHACLNRIPQEKSRRCSDCPHPPHTRKLARSRSAAQDEDDSWQKHQQDLYDRLSKEIVGDLYARLWNFRTGNSLI